MMLHATPKTPWPKLIRLTVLNVTCSIILTACETTRITATNSLCVTDNVISFSQKNDTPETVRQVREHNAAWRAVCNGKR